MEETSEQVAPIDRVGKSLREHERIVYSTEGRDGPLVRTRNSGTDEFEPPGETPVVAAVTGCRLVVYAPGDDGRSKREQRFPIHFSDVDKVGLDDPSDPGVFSLRSSGGVRWKIPVDATDTPTVVTVTRYVRTGADLYRRAHECAQLVQQRHSDLLTAAETGDDERLSELYEGGKERLGRVRERAEGTPFIEMETFTETLRHTRRTLDRTHTVALLVRIGETCDAREQAIDGGEFERATEEFRELRDWYATIRSRIRDGNIDSLGERRASTASTGTTGLSVSDEARSRQPTPLGAKDPDGAVAVAAERIRSLTAALLEEGRTAFESAAEQEEQIDRVDPLERALTLYSAVLYSCWGSPELVPMERQQLRYRREVTVADLIDVHRSIAERRTWVGYEALEAGETTTAMEEFDDALEHLESTHRLAREFRAGDPDAIAEQWEKLQKVRSEGVAVRD